MEKAEARALRRFPARCWGGQDRQNSTTRSGSTQDAHSRAVSRSSSITTWKKASPCWSSIGRTVTRTRAIASLRIMST